MKVKLGDVYNLQMGKTPTRDNLAFWGGKNKWISISDIGNTDKYISSTKEFITDEAVKKSGIKIVPKGTVIMSFKLSIGKVAITLENMYSNEAIMAFIDKKVCHIDTNYFYYLLLGKNWNLGTNKAVMGLTLNKATLSQIEVEIPSLEKQIYVASVLDKVSDLIALRKQQLAKLDELVKSRFVEMFGDPLSNVHKLNYTMPEVCEIIDGDRGKNYPKQEDFTESGYCLFLNAKNVTATGFQFDSCMFITKEKDSSLRKGKMKRGDIVLTTRGTLGNIAFYDNSVPFEHVRINSGMVILRMNHVIISDMFFIEQFKMQLAVIKQKIASGSAQPQLPISTMNQINLIVPPLSQQNEFAAFVEQVNKTKSTIQKSLKEMQLLFDSLMQTYFG